MSDVTVTHVAAWRAPWWIDDIPDREGWFVECPDHPELGKDQNTGEPWAYARLGDARSVRSRHLIRWHP